jgi:hypothetical protein
MLTVMPVILLLNPLFFLPKATNSPLNSIFEAVTPFLPSGFHHPKSEYRF